MLRRAGLALLLAAACAGAAAQQEARTPKPVIEPARGGQCVADPAFMRRNHMDLLKHQRDGTVHAGDRAGNSACRPASSATPASRPAASRRRPPTSA